MLCFYYHLPPKISPFCSKFLGKYMRGNFLFNIVAGCSPATLLKRDSETGVFPRVSRNFQEHILNIKVCKRLIYNFHSARLWTEMETRHFGRQTKPPNWSTALQTLFGKDNERTKKFFTCPCKSLYLPASAFFFAAAGQTR